VSTELNLQANRITVSLQTGRRGVEVLVSGALTFTPGTAWDDSALLVALVDADGAVLAMERDGLRFEEASGQTLLFSEACRLPEALASRVAAVEVWAWASVIDVREIGTVYIATELPAPSPGNISFQTVGGASIKLLPPDEGGEARLTVFGQYAFVLGCSYDSRAEVQIRMVDPEGAVLHVDDGSFETMNGQHGPAFFDVRFRPHISQLEMAHHMDLRILAKRVVTSERARVTRDAFTLVQDS
jgi:hypothetical protein